MPFTVPAELSAIVHQDATNRAIVRAVRNIARHFIEQGTFDCSALSVISDQQSASILMEIIRDLGLTTNTVDIRRIVRFTSRAYHHLFVKMFFEAKQTVDKRFSSGMLFLTKEYIESDNPNTYLENTGRAFDAAEEQNFQNIATKCGTRFDEIKNVDFCIIFFGSCGREEIAPYSDFDVGICYLPLLGIDPEVIKLYFSLIIQKLHYKLVRLGETDNVEGLGMRLCGEMAPSRLEAKRSAIYMQYFLPDQTNIEKDRFYCERRGSSKLIGTPDDYKTKYFSTSLSIVTSIFDAISIFDKGGVFENFKRVRPELNHYLQCRGQIIMEMHDLLATYQGIGYMDVKKTLGRTVQFYVLLLVLKYRTPYTNTYDRIYDFCERRIIPPELRDKLTLLYDVALLYRVKAQFHYRRECDMIYFDSQEAQPPLCIYQDLKNRGSTLTPDQEKLIRGKFPGDRVFMAEKNLFGEYLRQAGEIISEAYKL